MNFSDAMIKLWPNADQYIKGLRQGIIDSAPATFAKYGLTDKTALAQFMAQISHECGAGHDVVENLNYSASRMTVVWPSRFKTVGVANPYSHNPQALANKVYNGRMGNAAGSNDGWNYRGRGASQTTGKEGYDKLGKKMGLDLLKNPDLVNDPQYFLECGLADFIICGCMPFALKDDTLNVTKKLNGGTVGLAERKEWLVKWKAANVSVPLLGKPIAPVVVMADVAEAADPSESAAPVLPWYKRLFG